MARTGRALVVGGGVAGLAAAVELAERFDVEVREADDRLGGKIRTSPFAGLPAVDEAADAYLLRVPHAAAFAERVGVVDTVSPTGASAMIWHDGMHPIPPDVLLGVPAAVLPFVRSRLLGPRGKFRAALEPLVPRRDPEDSLGRLIRHRFGDEVHDRLVDALIGSIYAADTDRSSLRAVPQLADLAAANRSLLLGGRAARRRVVASGPIFAAPRAGTGALVDAAAEHLRRLGATIRIGTRVDRLERDGDGWRVDDDPFDVVVLASPARSTAPLVAPFSADLAAALGSVEHADVVMVRIAVPPDGLPASVVEGTLRGHSGYLVPKSRQRTVTAVSFASEKWAHWRPADGGHLFRASLGRDGLPTDHLDDTAAVAAVLEDLEMHLGAAVQPRTTSVTRWSGAFPQYRPHHHRLVERIDALLPAGLDVAGASYRGIGIPACIADGLRAARRLTTTIDD
ncbi:MAG: protoporphyrinogen oxidase [Ilumatobacteraceae bacterium]